MFSPARILIRCPNWVGDLAMATPVLEAVRQRFPDSHLVLAMRPHLEGLVRHGGYFDECVSLPRVRGPGELWQAVRRVRRLRCDLALLLTNSWESALTVGLAGIPERYGYARDGRGLLLTHALRSPRYRGRRIPRPMVQAFADLAGLLDVAVSRTRPLLVHRAADEEAWSARRRTLGLAPGAPYALLNPGASFGSSKVWNVESFARAAEGLAERFGLGALITVGPGEVDLGRAIVAAARVPTQVLADPILDLHDLKAAVAGSALLITTDTGTRQYGVAYRIPTVVLMGPTDARFTAVNLAATQVLRRALPCAPCHRKSCPLGHRKCMEDITPEDVLAAVGQLLPAEVSG